MLFSHFLSTAIVFESNKFSGEKYNSTKIINISNDHQFVFNNCNFFKCTSQNTAGGLFAKFEGNLAPSIIFQTCSFVSCSSNSCACFFTSGFVVKINSICSMSCKAKEYQIFNSFLFAENGIVECKLSQFDQCSSLRDPGESSTLVIDSPNIIFATNNHTRCSVRNSRSCGGFFASDSLKYMMNTNMNCTGSNYIHFIVQNGGKTQIEKSLFYKCHSYNELALSSVFLFSGKVSVHNFQFIRTQLNNFVKPEPQNQASSIIEFINCGTDIKNESLKLVNSEYIKIFNFAFGENANVAFKYIDYEHWKCATEPIPKMTDLPSQSSTILNPKDGLNLQQNSTQKSNSTIEVLFYFGLTILVLIALSFYLRSYRRKLIVEAPLDQAVDFSALLHGHEDGDDDETPLAIDGDLSDLSI